MPAEQHGTSGRPSSSCTYYSTPSPASRDITLPPHINVLRVHSVPVEHLVGALKQRLGDQAVEACHHHTKPEDEKGGGQGSEPAGLWMYAEGRSMIGVEKGEKGLGFSTGGP